MNVRISPAALSGELSAIPSKSHAHRLLICAALAGGPTVLEMGPGSDDISATEGCLRAMGAGVERLPHGLKVTPAATPHKNPQLNCGESGSTLRFMLPVAAAYVGRARFTGGGRLPSRPLGELVHVLQEHGVSFSKRELPFEIGGRLTGGEFAVKGNVSSQYITGLLLALPLLGEGGSIALSTPLESAPYVDMSLAALKAFGVQAHAVEGGYMVPGGQAYRSPGSIAVEGDWSNAAFFLCAGALGGGVRMHGLDLSSAQGDKAVLALLERFGAHVELGAGWVGVRPGELRGCTVDVQDVPDLLPVLAVVAACAGGRTSFINAGRLRLKESDRLQATAGMLRALGGKATELEDGLVVEGGGLCGGEVSSFHDHRIAMAAAVAAARCSGDVVIADAGAANKSYPGFYADYQKLGGRVYGF